MLLHTRLGYRLDEVISALQKNVRRGREIEAAFWTRELIESGFARYFWRRLMVIASEDCANAHDVCILVGQLAANAERAAKGFTGRVEGIIEVQAVLALCRAPKSREACDATCLVDAARRQGWRIQVRPEALDLHTARGRLAGKTVADFRFGGRYVAGPLQPADPTSPTRNDYELRFWGEAQPYLPRPDEPGGEPDVAVPFDAEAWHRSTLGPGSTDAQPQPLPGLQDADPPTGRPPDRGEGAV